MKLYWSQALLCIIAPCLYLRVLYLQGLYLRPQVTAAQHEPTQRINIHTLKALETEWRREAQQYFPADLWSQHDHFANKERQWISAQGYPEQDAFKTIDDSIRGETDLKIKQQRASTFPCMPRPFYD